MSERVNRIAELDRTTYVGEAVYCLQNRAQGTSDGLWQEVASALYSLNATLAEQSRRIDELEKELAQHDEDAEVALLKIEKRQKLINSRNAVLINENSTRVTNLDKALAALEETVDDRLTGHVLSGPLLSEPERQHETE